MKYLQKKQHFIFPTVMAIGDMDSEIHHLV